MYTLNQIAAVMSRTTGKKFVYKQIPMEEFRESLPFRKDIFVDAFAFGEEFGYYGAEPEKKVAWAVANAKGELSSFEKYLAAHPLKLE